MKVVNKILAVIFSIIIVLACIGVIFYVGDIIKADGVMNVLNMLVASREAKLTTIVVSSIIGLLAILFGASTEGADKASGGSLTLPLSTGNISISGQTFESMVLNVARKYNSLKNVKANVDIREDGLYVDLFVYVLAGTVVSDVVCKVQEDVKSTVLKQTTVEVKTVEVKVKGIYNQTAKSLTSNQGHPEHHGGYFVLCDEGKHYKIDATTSVIPETQTSGNPFTS